MGRRVTIVEFTPGWFGFRFARVGAYASAGAGRSRGQNLIYELGESPLASILQAPPACLYIYEGLTCAAYTRPGQALVEACAVLRSRRCRRAPTDFASLRRNLSMGLVDDESIVFRLYKVRVENDTTLAP